MAANKSVEANRKSIVDNLKKLGGAMPNDGMIAYEGTKVVIPKRWQGRMKEFIKFITTVMEQEEEYTTFVKEFSFHPWDVANATRLAFREVYGVDTIGQTIKTIFGNIPPQMITVQVDVNETITVPWGQMGFPLFSDNQNADQQPTMTLSQNRQGTPYLVIEAARKYEAAAHGFFTYVEEFLKSHSIYRGKAIVGIAQPEFIDLDAVDETKIVYSDQVGRQIDTNILAPIRDRETLTNLGLPSKRTVLLEGTFGTGKSLTGVLAAKTCRDNGVTYIQFTPGDDVEAATKVIEFARNYAPAVVFVEDVDASLDTSTEQQFSRLLEAFDGVTSKSQPIMIIMTTNYAERIPKAMLRPGRLDSIIHFDALDRNGCERLIRTLVDKDKIADDVDFDAVYDAMQGYVPAFITEAVGRVLRYAVNDLPHSRNENGDMVVHDEYLDMLQVTTQNFVDAAQDLRDHLTVMEKANEPTHPPQTIDLAMTKVVEAGVRSYNEG